MIGKCTSSDEQGDSPTAHCEAGYTGPGCTECAAGYVRRENQCRPDTGPNCNSAGTADVGLNGECYCKVRELRYWGASLRHDEAVAIL